MEEVKEELTTETTDVGEVVVGTPETITPVSADEVHEVEKEEE